MVMSIGKKKKRRKSNSFFILNCYFFLVHCFCNTTQRKVTTLKYSTNLTQWQTKLNKNSKNKNLKQGFKHFFIHIFVIYHCLSFLSFLSFPMIERHNITTTQQTSFVSSKIAIITHSQIHAFTHTHTHTHTHTRIQWQTTKTKNSHSHFVAFFFFFYIYIHHHLF